MLLNFRQRARKFIARSLDCVAYNQKMNSVWSRLTTQNFTLLKQKREKKRPVCGFLAWVSLVGIFPSLFWDSKKNI